MMTNSCFLGACLFFPNGLIHTYCAIPPAPANDIGTKMGSNKCTYLFLNSCSRPTCVTGHGMIDYCIPIRFLRRGCFCISVEHAYLCHK